MNAAFQDINVRLIAGHGGVFDVALNDKLIYSKSNIGRFPDAGEITNIIKDA